MIWRREKIWSMQDRPCLKPACCWRNSWSTVFCIRFSKTLANTLPGMDKSVVPHQLLQSVMSPFFGNGMMIPLLQSTGTTSCCCVILLTNYSMNVTVECDAVFRCCRLFVACIHSAMHAGSEARRPRHANHADYQGFCNYCFCRFRECVGSCNNFHDSY